MKIFVSVIKVLLALVIAGGVFYILNTCYDLSPEFRSLFTGNTAPAQGAGVTVGVAGNSAAAPTAAMRGEVAGRVSMYIFFLIFLMQFSALCVACAVIGRIRKGDDTAEVKLAKYKNADIFLDLPLYIGLFGTVSSFLVMTFSPQSSRLIAYSSTLIGIIFSVCMRIGLLFPARQKLLSSRNCKCEGAK